MLTRTTDGGLTMCASHWEPGEWEATVRSLSGEDSHPGPAGAEEEPRLCSTTAQLRDTILPSLASADGAGLGLAGKGRAVRRVRKALQMLWARLWALRNGLP